uniref:Large ribosomal subunit protein uL11 C-terminal domain-containing protein n=1 Tax=Ananas comosus var. bracteatus TaxID=296719 RepID=A0A6V7NNP5_ANACO|nr:unnamed protein product [Ananas comosus var. bracteatus]
MLQSYGVLFESLRRLQLMELSVQTLQWPFAHYPQEVRLERWEGIGDSTSCSRGIGMSTTARTTRCAAMRRGDTEGTAQARLSSALSDSAKPQPRHGPLLRRAIAVTITVDLDHDRKKTKNIKHNGNISLDDVVKIAHGIRPRSMGKDLSGIVKEILAPASPSGAPSTAPTREIGCFFILLF